MKAIYHPDQRLHDPKYFLSSGKQYPNPEVPRRIDALLSGLSSCKIKVEQPTDHGMQPIAQVHSSEYIEFLKNIYRRWQYIDDASEEVIPNIHPDNRTVNYPKSAVGQAGFHMSDTACPISGNTWASAYYSAQSAIEAACLVAQEVEDCAYALCRPPGHHAFSDLAGGFCFLNNTAIAAQYCRRAGRWPAILDVDLHHGNGTQAIFYHREDVLTISIHADPIRYYPFFWGHANERGQGRGLGSNMNLPLPRGSKDEEFIKQVDLARQRIESFGADVLIIALGLDAFEGDPFGGLSVSTQGFAEIARYCAELNLPTIIVQEGGYMCPELGDNLASFLNGFNQNHHKQR